MAGLTDGRGIHFGKIYVVEWLRPGDGKTGWERSEAIVGIAEIHKPTVRVAFKPATEAVTGVKPTFASLSVDPFKL
jgi:hypothetical protein